LKDYLKARGAEGDQRIFPITYTAARVMVKKAGTLVGVHLRPHDLRRHAATYASRSGVSVEIVSEVDGEFVQVMTSNQGEVEKASPSYLTGVEIPFNSLAVTLVKLAQILKDELSNLR
jgi:hypothetical protein